MVHLILCPAPQEKAQGVRSELLAGHSWGLRHPSQCPGNVSPNHASTEFAKWGGAPSCMKIRLTMFSQPDTLVIRNLEASEGSARNSWYHAETMGRHFWPSFRITRSLLDDSAFSPPLYGDPVQPSNGNCVDW
jgi:hypothetical protein